MFAVAFFGITAMSLALITRMGAVVPVGVLRGSWRLFGLSLLSVGGFTLLAQGVTAGSAALVPASMVTLGVRCLG